MYTYVWEIDFCLMVVIHIEVVSCVLFIVLSKIQLQINKFEKKLKMIYDARIFVYVRILYWDRFCFYSLRAHTSAILYMCISVSHSVCFSVWCAFIFCSVLCLTVCMWLLDFCCLTNVSGLGADSSVCVASQMYECLFVWSFIVVCGWAVVWAYPSHRHLNNWSGWSIAKFLCRL